MSDPFASRALIRRLTAKKRRDAQIRALQDMGIPYVLDGDGHPLVPVERVSSVANVNDQPRFGHLRK